MNIRKNVIHFGLSSILLVGILASCKKTEAPTPTSETTTDNSADTGVIDPQARYTWGSSTSTTTTLDRQKMLTLVNNARKTGCNCGGVQMPPVAPVTLNDQLNTAAQGHSNWMNTNRTLSHYGANGSNPGTRITAAGYNWLTWAENAAAGFSTEESVMKGWLGSSGHCKNIMSAKVKELGIGRAGNYWTQDFATKR